jgi:hypothetical protein
MQSLRVALENEMDLTLAYKKSNKAAQLSTLHCHCLTSQAYCVKLTIALILSSSSCVALPIISNSSEVEL